MLSIFLSSTFQDMQQERDMFNNILKPKILELTNQYGFSVNLCDLRWGIETSNLNEQESTKRIINYCFNEIISCKPFFLCILGDRYGWVPDKKLIDYSFSNHDLKAELDYYYDKSITELEIVYSILLSQEENMELIFLIREIDNLEELKEKNPEIYSIFYTESKEKQEKLENLKNKIIREFPNHVFKYHVSWDFENNKFNNLDEFNDIIIEFFKKKLKDLYGDYSNINHYDQLKLRTEYLNEDDAFIIKEDKFLELLENDLKLILENFQENNYSLILKNRDSYELHLFINTLVYILRSKLSNLVFYNFFNNKVQDYRQLLLFLIYQIYLQIDNKESALDFVKANENLDIEELKKVLKRVIKNYETNKDESLVIILENTSDFQIDISNWLPNTELKKIKFLFAGNFMNVSSLQKNLVINQTSKIFTFEQFTELYLQKEHKTISEILLKRIKRKFSNFSSYKYLEAILERLISLDQEDFNKILLSGDGIENINRYLEKIIMQTPDDLPNLIKLRIHEVEEITSKEFSKISLLIISLLDLGFPLEHLIRLSEKMNVPWNILDYINLKYKLGFLLQESADGYVKFTMPNFKDYVQSLYILDLLKVQDTAFEYIKTLDRDDPFFKESFFQLGYITKDKRTLLSFLKFFKNDSNFISNEINQILKEKGSSKWLVNNLEMMDIKDKIFVLDWFTTKFKFDVIEESSNFSELKLFWKELINQAKNLYNANFNKANNVIYFYSLYLYGNILYRNNDLEQAIITYDQALHLAKESFINWPSSMYKDLHGIKEKNPEILELKEKYPGITFGFNTDLAESIKKIAYAPEIRIIYSNLANIYKILKNESKSQIFQTKANELIHLIDIKSPEHTIDYIDGVPVINLKLGESSEN